jgi:hypothetical protein
VVSFRLAFPPIIYKRSSSPICATWPAHLILLDSIILIILAKSTNHEAPRYAIFSIHPSPHLPSVQISSSGPCSQTASACVPPLMSETKFHTHTEPQTKLSSCVFWCLSFLTADEKTEGSGRVYVLQRHFSYSFWESCTLLANCSALDLTHVV